MKEQHNKSVRPNPTGNSRRAARRSFADRLSEVVGFHHEHDRLPTSAEPGGEWVLTLRRAARRGSLSDERRAELDRHLPNWNQTLEDVWNARLEQAAALRKEQGDSLKFTGPTGVWLNNQRNLARRGKLSPERREQLDRHLPGWDAPRQRPFSDHVAAVATVQSAQGRLPHQDEPEGHWLSAQRQALARGTLAPERQTLLDEQLPDWKRAGQDTFEEHLKAAAASYRELGRRPKSSEPGARWLNTQRRLLATGRLTPERRALLDARIPGWNVTQNELWNAHLSGAADFYNLHGRVPRARDAEGAWLANQRRAAITHKISAERAAELDRRLPGWRGDINGRGGDHESRWNAHLERLTAAVEQLGRLPRQCESEGRWLADQREAAKKGKISHERRQKLDALVPGWDTKRDQVWQARLETAVAFHETSGRMPKRREPAGQWLVDQRQRARKGTLSPERRALLDQQLPGWDARSQGRS